MKGFEMFLPTSFYHHSLISKGVIENNNGNRNVYGINGDNNGNKNRWV